VSRGGDDFSVFVPRFNRFFVSVLAYPGAEVPDGWAFIANLEPLLLRSRPNAEIRLDSIGIGASAYDLLQQDQYSAYQILPMVANGRARNHENRPYTDKTGRLCFNNLSSYWGWTLRELLDPLNGFNITIPDDQALLEELACFEWFETKRQYTEPGAAIANYAESFLQEIRITSSDEIRTFLGRSPDRAKALMFAAANVNQESKAALDYWRNLRLLG
jgi:hypothetical protein